MSLIVVEGFDAFPTGDASVEMGAAGWSGALGSMRIVVPGRFAAGKCLHWIGAAPFGSTAYLAMPSNLTTTFVGVAMKFSEAENISQQSELFIGLVDGIPLPAKLQVVVALGRNGIVRVYSGDPSSGDLGPILATSLPAAFLYGVWFYLEIGSTIDNAGSVEVRINTVPIITLASVDTEISANPSWNMLAFFDFTDIQATRDVYLDDLYVNDDA